jgi:long-chain acyl-CoA synthetase
VTVRLDELLDRHAATRPGHIALRWAGGSLTYEELRDRVDALAGRLRAAAGVAPGDRVCFLDRNAPEHIVVQFAAARLGAVFAPLNFRLASPELAEIVADCEPAACLVGEAYAEALASVRVPVEVISVSGSSPDPPTSPAPLSRPARQPVPEDLAMVLYTSGTTGRPKGIELTCANIDAALARFEPTLGLGAGAISLDAMPMFHVGGGMWALAGVVAGATSVIVRDFDARAVAALLAAQRVTHAALVPAMIAALLEAGEHDFGALTTIAYGASPIPEPLLGRAVRAFPRCGFYQGYGLTETTSTVVQLEAADHVPGSRRLRSVGRPIGGAAVRIVDPLSGADVDEPRAVGEIWVRGPTVMRGYWRAPELTAETLVEGGWLRTGDAGYRDADGYLYLHDRVKDMIVSGGENVYPAEIERVLEAHPGVAEVAVVGVAHARWGETPKAFVVERGGGAPAPTADELIDYCRERLARYKCPTVFAFVAELPRNAAGKVLKRSLR